MGASRSFVLRSVTAIMGVVVGLAFLFGFGNVLTLAIRLGVPFYVAPLVAPAVDLSVLALLIGTRYLAIQGAPAKALRPAQRLLLFASMVTLALNVAEPVYERQFGKATFDAVGPLLLIGWAEIGPGLLQAIQQAGQSEIPLPASASVEPSAVPDRSRNSPAGPDVVADKIEGYDMAVVQGADPSDPLLSQACQLDAEHWTRYRRPIAAETLRKRLKVGSRRSRTLTNSVRSRYEPGAAQLTAVSVPAVRW